jgi:hypothetical protein
LIYESGAIEMTTIRRTEPTTATVSVAITVGASALSRIVGAPTVPLSVFQPIVPIAETVGRLGLDTAKRAGFVMLLVAVPMWGGFHAAGLDSFDDGGFLSEVPSAAIVVMMAAGVLLIQLMGKGVLAAPAKAYARASAGNDATSRWVVAARAVFKRRRRSRLFRGATFSAAPVRRGFLFSTANHARPVLHST